jgi:hypothetical protein
VAQWRKMAQEGRPIRRNRCETGISRVMTDDGTGAAAPRGADGPAVTDVAPPETDGITRPLRKVASGPPAEGVAGADLLQPALSETPPAAAPGLQ